MAAMPTMSDEDWERFQEWTKGFAALGPSHAQRNQRKQSRKLKIARKAAEEKRRQLPLVTAAVTKGAWVHSVLEKWHAQIAKEVTEQMNIDMCEAVLRGDTATTVRAAGAAARTNAKPRR